MIYSSFGNAVQIVFSKFFFLYLRSFWCVDLKINFLKIKKNIILMHFSMKNTLKNNRNHITKQVDLAMLSVNI